MQILSNLSLYGTLGLNSVADANTDTDKFLVIDSSGIVKYRTGAELYNDIGAGGAAAYTSVLQHTVKAGVALTKGQAVYVSSADGTNMIVSKASNATEQTSSKTLGLIAQDLAINGQGFVITEGLLSGLDTSTANAGDPVWLGTDGNLIYGLGAKPYAPAHLVFIGIVTRVQQNNGEIFVKVQNGFELQELHNVQITSTPADNTVLAYETSTSLYKMKSIPTLLGYTPVTNARSITINGTTYDLSADRSWSVGTHTGNLTTGYVPKATGATTLTDSLIYDNGSGIGINTSSPYESSAFKLDVNGGLLIKNTSGTTAQLILINSNPATGGNNGFVQLSAGGNTETAFGQWQTYYGMSVTAGALRLQPAGGQVLIGTTTTSAFLTDINGTLRVSGQLTLGSTISNNTYVYTMPGASGTLALVSQIPSLSGYLTIASADATYLTQSSAASIYLSQTSASNTYLTISGASSTYLSQANASNTYLTISGASSIYLSQTSASNTYLTINGASSIYLSQTSASNTYLTINNAASTYVSLSGSYANPSWITSLAWSKITGAPAFLTSYTETDTLASVTARGATTSTATVFNGGLFARRSQTAGNYTTAALWTESYDNTTTGIAFHISGNQGKFLEMRTNGILYWHGDTVWHSGNLTNLNQLSNGPGYITGYTETDTLASVTGRGATTSSPLYFSGGSSTTPALHIRSGGSNWSEGLAIHPLTDNTYALAFFRTKSSYTDNTDTWALGNMGETGIINHFALLRRGLTGSSVNGSGNAVFSVNPNGTFSFGFTPNVGSNAILHAGNYNSYSPTLTGGGASGTWGINITGNASSSTTTTHLSSRTDGAWYNVIWGAGSPSYLYSSDSVRILSSEGALRANIYYDNQNTAFYLDPASTSNLNSVIYPGGITYTGSAGSTALNLATNDGYASMRVIRNNMASSPFNDGMYIGYANASGGITRIFGGGSTSGGISVNGGGVNDVTIAGNVVLNAGNYTSYTIPIGGGWYGSGLPGSRWYGYSVNGGEFVLGNGLPNAGQVGVLIDGCYVAAENNGFWSLSSDNTWGSRRGMFWDGSQLNFTTNSPIALFSDVRATIFYDSNDTGYYADFNSTSNSAMRVRGGTLYGPNPTWGAYLQVGGNGWGGSYASVVATNGNLHLDSAPGYAMYLNNYANGVIYFNGGSYYISSNGSYYNGRSEQVTINYNNDSNASYQLLWGSGNNVYGTGDVWVNPSSDVINARGGFISNGNPWGTSNSAFFPNGITTAGGTNWIYGFTYIGNAPGNGAGHEFYTSGSSYSTGNIEAGGSMRAPIFYDRNDTNYYLDPNGTSNLQTWTADTAARLGRSRYWTNRWAIYGGINDHMTGTNGWGMDHGGWDQAWKGGFSGWDIWGTGTGHPQGGGYIHAQGIISGQHAASSDGSTAYGWMMVGAHNATENRYWLRGKWGGSTSGWVEMISSGNIGSQSVNYANTAGNVNNISSAVGGSYTWTATNYFRSTGGGYSGSLASPPLQAYSDSNNSAYMSFHKGGHYAVNLGLDADNVMRIGGWSASANRWQLDMSGNMTVAGDVTAYSDARVKENVITVDNALSKVLSLRGVYYNRTDSEDKNRKIGVIAQETMTVIPEVVNQDNAGMYNVSYGNLGGLFIEAFKEQQKKIEAQDIVIEELKAKLDAVTK